MDNIASANKLRKQSEILKPKENDNEKEIFEKEKALFLEKQQKILNKDVKNESLKNKESKNAK